MRVLRSFAHHAVFTILVVAILGLPPKLNAQSRTKKIPWPTFVQNYLDGYFVHRPDVAVAAGRHDFDGKLPELPELERYR